MRRRFYRVSVVLRKRLKKMLITKIRSVKKEPPASERGRTKFTVPGFFSGRSQQATALPNYVLKKDFYKRGGRW